MKKQTVYLPTKNDEGFDVIILDQHGKEIGGAKKVEEYIFNNDIELGSDIYNTLIKWWDFMDKDNTAHREEYLEEEQVELILNFIKSMEVK